MGRWWRDYTLQDKAFSTLQVHAWSLLTYVGGSASTFLAWWLWAGCP